RIVQNDTSSAHGTALTGAPHQDGSFPPKFTNHLASKPNRRRNRQALLMFTPEQNSAPAAETRFPSGAGSTTDRPDKAPDPFHPASLRLSGDLSAALGVKKALLTVPVRKPDKSWFVRTHADEAYRLETTVLELKEDRETYLVNRPLWAELAAE